MKKEFKTRKIGVIIQIILAVGFIIALTAISANAEVPVADYCCEKTTYGAWCQNTKQENCDASFRKTPTSCDATAFCKPGCCYDSQEGLCMENTPQKVCDLKNGTWADSAECEIPQCNLGCCVLDHQAALVTLTRCKRLSGFYGLLTDFRNNINDELTCIAIAQAQDRGACVFEQEYSNTCKFTTRIDCESITGTAGNSSTGKPTFYKDYLCSAEELGSLCGPTSNTMCVDGKDEVYFKDSCGNPANIYDASKLNDKSYWKKIIDKSGSCGAGNLKGNANSKDCGNCDYYLGSICKETARAGTKATYGNYICKDLDCKASAMSDGKDHRHGESWCSYDKPTEKGMDTVGSRFFRHLCVAGEEIVEACDDFRKQTCIQNTVDTTKGKFQEAACRANRWQDCVSQVEQDDCENTDKRDCYWLEGLSFPEQADKTQPVGTQTGQVFTSTSTTGGVVGTGKVAGTGEALFGIGGSDSETETTEKPSGVQKATKKGGACLPNIPPGFKFWETGDGEAASLCGMGSSKCIVTYEKGLLGSKTCSQNCECLSPAWASDMNKLCVSLGDCGNYVNYLGKYTDDGITWLVGKEKKEIEQDVALKGFTGNIIRDMGINEQNQETEKQKIEK